MFFRREKQRTPSFDERLESARQAGFQTAPAKRGGTFVTRGICAARVEDVPNGLPKIVQAGLRVGDEVGVLTDGGYQKFWLTDTGARLPALAAQLRELHDFTEDLREALGLISFYNEGLGTVNQRHMYDRVLARDQGPAHRPWDRD